MDIARTEQVWIFDIPGSVPGAPTLAGYLTRSPHGAGTFTYDVDYMRLGPALDRKQLRNLRRPTQIKSDERRGIPGIIADAGPDAWGEKVLEMDLGYRPDPLEALVHVRDDGVGNLMIGDPAKARLLPPTTSLDEIEAGIQNRLDGIDDPAVRYKALYLSPDTALGGGKPKASILLQDEMWIAKFPDRGDPADLAFQEAAAMEMMRRIILLPGIVEAVGSDVTHFDVAHTAVHTFSNGKSALLVKRFDREAQGDTMKRFGFASARTVIGMLDSEPTASYQDFALATKSWVPSEQYKSICVKIWLRLAYNALVGNMDDHPRNHALLQLPDMSWDLSPAYDVLPKTTPALQVALSMTFHTVPGIPGQVSRSGAVTAESLLRSSMDFGIRPEVAKAILLSLAEQIQAEWEQVLQDIKAPQSTYDFTSHTIAWVGYLHKQLAQFLIPTTWATKRSRSWSWRP